MNDPVDFRTLERKWLARWDSETFTPDDGAVDRGDREARYALTMFPYPSGDLHMGHAEVFALHDVTARYWRMKGYEVFNPIGWDSFGLPAENAAIKRGQHPRVYTDENIETQAESLRAYGTSFDWTHRFQTSDPAYYRWTQWLFLKLYEAGLAERRDAPVNWCPTDQTVLANEQVIDGRCDRCETLVTKRVLNQWYFKMKPYAQRLLDDMASLTAWPTPVLNRQRAWIGRSEGARIRFTVEDSDETIEVYTTRPDTLHGVTFLALAPDSDQAARLNRNPAFESYVETVRRTSDIERQTASREKTGFDLGVRVTHPVTGELLPVYAADYVLAQYGSGAIMGVPAHDERDAAFAVKYDLPVREAITDGEYVGLGLRGASQEEAIRRVVEALPEAEPVTDFRLRDWLVSRQRYWGPPIPMIHCDGCGTVPVPESDLPVTLPELSGPDLAPKGTSPLAAAEDWVNVGCPACGADAKRDTDTMDTFVDSSWYFLRYPSAHNDEQAWAPEDLKRWGPVDQYMGGAEHATMHLLYSRFITKVLHDLGLVDFDEPFSSLITQGVVINEGERMRKSKANGVDLGEQLSKYGVDAVRMSLVFAGPPEDNIDWANVKPDTAQRFLSRCVRLAQDVNDSVSSTQDEDLRRVTHQVRAAAEAALDASRFNVCIARVMELVNATRKAIDAGNKDSSVREAVETVAVLLSLVAPFTAEEMWSLLGHTSPVASAPFPTPNPSYLVEETVTCIVQVNGKVRGKVEVSPQISDEDLTGLAREAVQSFLTSEVRRVVAKPPRFVNFVL